MQVENFCDSKDRLIICESWDYNFWTYKIENFAFKFSKIT